MNVYVFVGGKVIEFRDSLDFEFQPISKGKGLVEVNGESGGSVVIGEGDAVLLGGVTPVIWKRPEGSSRAISIGAGDRWFVLRPITRHARETEGQADILTVYGQVQAGFQSAERVVGVFWLRVGDLFIQSWNIPSAAPEPEPEERQQ